MYKFEYEEKEYILNKENFSEILNDEEKPLNGLDLEKVLSIISEKDDIEFDVEYYQEACPSCMYGVKEKQKFFPFLEYHFYVFSKNGEYIISDISKEYEGLSFNKLSRAKKVDDSYIVSLIICKNCNDYIVQIENCIV